MELDKEAGIIFEVAMQQKTNGVRKKEGYEHAKIVKISVVFGVHPFVEPDKEKHATCYHQQHEKDKE